MDTNAYDVNVSPDKRTILLHDSAKLVEELRTCLSELFEQQEQTMPQSQLRSSTLLSFTQLPVRHGASIDSSPSVRADGKQVIYDQMPSQDTESDADRDEAEDGAGPSLSMHEFSRNQPGTREDVTANDAGITNGKVEKARQKMTKATAEKLRAAEGFDEDNDVREVAGITPSSDQDIEETLGNNAHARYVDDFMEGKQRMPEEPTDLRAMSEEASIPVVSPIRPLDQSNVVQNAFDRMRPKRPLTETATITVGDKTVTTVIGSQRPNKVQIMEGDLASKRTKRSKTVSRTSSLAPRFSQKLRHFVAPGADVDNGHPSEEHSMSPDDAETRSDQSNEDSGFRTEYEIQPDEHELKLERRVVEPDTRSEVTSNGGTDGDYVDEAEKKAQEEARVAELIRAAEEGATYPSKDSVKRANKVAKCRFSTTGLQTRVDGSIGNVDRYVKWMQWTRQSLQKNAMAQEDESTPEGSEEDRLSLTVSKGDFARMHIVGQFNLGFILAVRPPPSSLDDGEYACKSDELFIIDQHASDEKFNFERLQVETVISSQRMVRPMLLELTAVEEEVVIENGLALEKNGFVLDVDTSGEQPIGQRCRLLSLPLSKEVVFDSGDLDELLHLLAESPPVGPESVVPRPSKARKMFAMRACRSSIMVGKTLTSKQMSTVVRHMGMIDKPWNCPHGRPTMRHLLSLNTLDVWDERDRSGGVVWQDKTEAEIWTSYGR
jgi:DNA mismatch repair protein PMS2